MKRLLLLLVVLGFTGCLRAQGLNRLFPFNGYSAEFSQLLQFNDSWLMLTNTTITHTRYRTVVDMLKLDKSGDTLWQKQLPTKPEEVFYMVYAESLPDGRFLTIGYLSDYLLNTQRTTVFLLDASGQVIWQSSLSNDVAAGISIVGASSMTVAPESDAIWIGAWGTSGFRVLMQLSTGKVIKIWRFSVSPMQLGKALRDGQGTIAWYDGRTLSVFRDSVWIRDIVLNELVDNLGGWLPALKVYPVAPQIAILGNSGNLILADINGDTTIIRNQFVQGFDIRNGEDIVLVRGDLSTGAPYPLHAIFYQREDNRFVPVQQQDLPDLNSNYNLVKEVQWAGQQVQITGQAKMGVANVTNGFLYFQPTESNAAGFACTVDPATGPAPIPQSNVGITYFDAGTESWWYQDSVGAAAVYKLNQAKVVIQNYGSESLHSVILCARNFDAPGLNWYADTSFYQRFEDLNIPPGGSDTLLVGDMQFASTDYFAPHIRHICLWTALPNDELDSDRTNDYFCGNVPEKKVPKPDRMRIFPNPVDNQLFISLDDTNTPALPVLIANLDGRIAFEGTVNNEGGYYVVNTALIQPGVYALRVGEHITKLIKE